MRLDKSGFQNFVRRILVEELEKSSAGNDEKIYQRVPEVTHGEDYKKITPYERDDRTKDELLDDLTKLVKGVDDTYVVGWDDHDDISINNARDLFRIRIIPKWDNNYCIEAFTRNEDRIYVTGQSWEQVKAFVKQNLKKAETAVEKAAAKVVKNREDKTSTNDKGMSQKDKPKILPLTNEKPKTAKKEDKNYTEKIDDDDSQFKPMKEVEGFKRQEEHKSRSALALRREKTKFPQKKPNTKLEVKVSDQDTSKLK